MDSIGNRIKQVRLNSGLSQKDFGKIIRTSNGHLSAIERNKAIPSDRIIRLICNEIKVNENWLKSGIGKSPIANTAEKGKKIFPDPNFDLEHFKNTIGKRDINRVNAF